MYAYGSNSAQIWTSETPGIDTGRPPHRTSKLLLLRTAMVRDRHRFLQMGTPSSSISVPLFKALLPPFGRLFWCSCSYYCIPVRVDASPWSGLEPELDREGNPGAVGRRRRKKTLLAPDRTIKSYTNNNNNNNITAHSYAVV